MIEAAAPSESGFSDIDLATDPAAYVRRLDDAGASAFWRTIKQRTFAQLDPREGDQLLDVGCGTGDDARLLARLVGPTGRVVGLDRSATMIAEARRRAAISGLPVAYHQGDAQHLAFADGVFDGCRAERILQHLSDPERALAAMVRVLRPGGRLVVVEPDYGLQAMQGADQALTATLLAARCQHFRSGRIGSRLPSLYKALGLTGVSVAIAHLVSVDFARDRARLERWVARANTANVIAAADGEAWLADLDQAGRAGRYCHAIPVFLVSGAKP